MSVLNPLHERLSRAVRCSVHTPDQLHAWVRLYLRMNVPRASVCAGHDSPFDYLCNAYFEPARDQIVVAPRGGGKTRLAAVATLLDLLHKPGCAVRILGGSFEQSLRMWEHLLPDLEKLCAPELPTRGLSPSVRRVRLRDGASAAVLAQSQRAVRGLRVQKLRCDEVELFDPDVWDAAQLVTRSTPGASATIEALSTHHLSGGLMSKLLDDAPARGVRVVRWCLLEVLQRCAPERDCATCPLWTDCQGIAKTRCNGFVSIDDAIAMIRRVSRDTWETEMLCRRPGVRGSVFPRFDVSKHVRELTVGQPEALRPSTLALDFGFHNPFVCLWVATQPRGDGSTLTHVLDEYVQSGRTVDEHLSEIESRSWGKVMRVACDPAGASNNDQTADSNVRLLRRRGYAVHFRASRIVEGVESVRSALCNGVGEPSLFIHPRCARLVKALQWYRYPPNGGELPLKDGEHDHLVDALRYHFVNAPGRWTSTTRVY